MSERDFTGSVARRLRRYLDGDLVELALRAVLVYVVVGVVYTALHIELLDQLEDALSGQFTTFADYAALAVTIALWPLLAVSALVCGVAGCGVL